MKKFISGLCVPSKHYMVDLSERVNLIIDNDISQRENNYPDDVKIRVKIRQKNIDNHPQQCYYI